MRNSHFSLRRALGALSLALALSGVCAPARANTDKVSFWDMTAHATTLMGFSREASESVTWSNWIIHWYLSDQSGYRRDSDRNALVRGMRPHFSSLRMGDLKSSAQVNAAMARVAAGTFAGLMDARDRNDVAAAHNVLGASLRSVQEFYVRSNWLGDASRKSITYFEMPPAQRATAPIWTGATTLPVIEPQSPLGHSVGENPQLPPLPNPEAKPAGDVSMLAVRHGLQWLQILERAMKKAGAGEFWNRVKTTAVDPAQRQLQFQTGTQVTFTFLTEPVGSPAGDWWLRLQLQSGTELGAGTDGDIIARVGDKQFPLDWKHDAAPVETYNDFEAGSNDAYFIGPFDTLPSEVQLINKSPGLVEGVLAAPLTVIGMLGDGVEVLNDGLNDLMGMKDDYVKTEAKTFTSGTLNDQAAERDFSIDLDGKDEGFYRVHGKLTRTGRGAVNTWIVHLTELECVRESKIDRLTNSDEPYILLNIQALPGETITWRNEPFADVDKGERFPINYRSPEIKIHAFEGMLHVAVCVMEQDGSQSWDRDAILQRFTGKLKEQVPHSYAEGALKMGAGLTGDWKLDRMTVTAWNRSGALRQGKMFNAPVGKWIGAGKTEIFPLSGGGVRETGVTLDDLLPNWHEFKKQPEPTTPPTTPAPSTPPASPAPGNFDLSVWVDEWDTTMGRVKLESEGGVLRGRLMQKDEWGRAREGERLELRGDGNARSLAGTASYSGFQSQMTLAMLPDGESFIGTVLLRGETKPNNWSGKRVRATTVPSLPTTPTIPASPIVPPVVAPPVVTPPIATPPVTPPVVTPPLPTPPVTPPATVPTTPIGAPVGDGKFYPLTKFEIRLDKVEVARDRKLHAFVTFKNPSGAEQMLINDSIKAFLEDADGLAFRVSRLSRASTPEPEDFANQPNLAPGAELKARFVLDTLKGGAPVRSLTFEENGATAAFDLSGVSVPGLLAQPSTTAAGATGEWKQLGIFDVRFDGARPQRGSAFSEIFFTFRNPSEKPQQIFFAGGTFKIWMADPDGSMQHDQYNLYSVRGMSPESMPWQPFVMPGREIRLRFLYRGPVAPMLSIEDSASGTKQTYATR